MRHRYPLLLLLAWWLNSGLGLHTDLLPGRSGAADDDADFRSQAIKALYPLPAYLEKTFPQPLAEHLYVRPGARIGVEIEMLNSGTSDWQGGGPGTCSLDPIPDFRAWAGSKGLSSEFVFPGSSNRFEFLVVAPAAEMTGGYHFQWRMVRYPFSEFDQPVPYGERSPAVKIHVDGTPPAGTARFPASLPINQPFTITGTALDHEGNDNSGIHGVEVRIDGVSGTATRINGSWSNWRYQSAGVAAGIHEAEISIIDRAGNVATTGHFTFTTDQPPPSMLALKSPVTGGFSSTNNPCQLSAGETRCATTIAWQTEGTKTAQVWVGRDGESAQLFACGPDGRKEFAEVEEGHVYRFFLYPASSCLDPPIAESELAGTAVTAARPAIGLNAPNLSWQYRGSSVNQALGRKAIIDAKNLGITYLSFQAITDINQWRQNPANYWGAFDRLLGDLETNSVRAVPVFLWWPEQFRDLTGEQAIKLLTDENSSSYRMLVDYITDFINRYRGRSSIYFYQLTNGLNGGADANRGTEPAYSTDQVIEFTRRLAAEVRRLDPRRLITSGFTLPHPFAERLRGRAGWSPNTGFAPPDSPPEFQRYLADLHQDLDIVSVDFFNGFRNNERFEIFQGKNNADLLRLVKQTCDDLGKQLFVSSFADRNPYVYQDRTAPFTQNTLNQIVQLSIPYSGVWLWQSYANGLYPTFENDWDLACLEPGLHDFIIARIKQTNIGLGNSLPASQMPDLTAPQAVLSWPQPNSQLARNQLVFATVSDNSGAIARVEFLVDDMLRATIARPPYQFRLASDTLTPGSHRISVKAYDAAGNVAQQNINVNRPAAFPSVISVSAASFSETAFAGEAIAASFGSDLARTTLVATELPLPMELAGTQVMIKDSRGEERLAPLFFVSPGQINYLIPAGTAEGPAEVAIRSDSGAVATGAISIGRVAPGLFTVAANGEGLAAATVLRVRSDGSHVFEPVGRFEPEQNRFLALPIDLGPELGEASDEVYLMLFGTGLRRLTRLEAVSVTVGGVLAETTYAGPQGSFSGLDQVNVLLPRSLAGRGDVEVILVVDGRAANTVRLQIR